MRVFIAFLMLMAGLGASAQVVSRNELRNTNNAILAATVRGTNGIQRGLTTNQGRIQFQTANTNTFQFGGSGKTISFLDNVSGITFWSFDHETDKLTETIGTHEVVGTIKAQNYQSSLGNNGATTTGGGATFENGFLISGLDSLVRYASPTNTVNVAEQFTNNLQAAWNAYPSQTRFIGPGKRYTLTSTLTNPVGSIEPFFDFPPGTEFFYAGPTNGTESGAMVSLDSCHKPKFHGISFIVPHTNSTRKVFNIDQVKGGGTMTQWELKDCTLRLDNTNYALEKWIVMVSTNSADNCEGGRFINCMLQGQGYVTNRTIGYFIGDNANALLLRIEGGEIKYCTNGLYMKNGSIRVQDQFLTGNGVDYYIAGSAGPSRFVFNRSEVGRQFFVLGPEVGGTSQQIIFVDNEANDSTFWDTSLGVLGIGGIGRFSFYNNNFGTWVKPSFETFVHTGPGVSAVLDASVANRFTTNSDSHALRGFTDAGTFKNHVNGTVRLVGGSLGASVSNFGPVSVSYGISNTPVLRLYQDGAMAIPSAGLNPLGVGFFTHGSAISLDAGGATFENGINFGANNPIIRVEGNNRYSFKNTEMTAAGATIRASDFHPIGMNAGKLVRTDTATNLSDVTIGAGLSFDGTTLSASGGGSGLSSFKSNNVEVLSAPTILETTNGPGNVSAFSTAVGSTVKTYWAVDSGVTQGMNSAIGTIQSGYVTLATPQTITAQKVFGNASAAHNTLTISNSDVTFRVGLAYAFGPGGVAATAFTQDAGTNDWRLVSDIGTSGSHFILAQRDNRSLTFGVGLLNTISNNAIVVNNSNVINVAGVENRGTVTNAAAVNNASPVTNYAGLYGVPAYPGQPSLVGFASTNQNGKSFTLQSALIATNMTLIWPTNGWNGQTAPFLFAISNVVGDANGTTGQVTFITRGSVQSPWTGPIDANSQDLTGVNELSTANLTTTGSASIGTTVSVGQQVTTKNVRFPIVLPSITQSNLIVSGATNTIECVGGTNVVLTNIVEEATGTKSETVVLIRNTIGVSVPIVWPAFGAQHGYYFHTNGLNDVLSASVAPPGTNTAIALVLVGSNVYPSVTYWKHP